MSTNSKKMNAGEKFTALGAQLQVLVPHLSAVLAAEDEFIELRIKSRPDGSMLVILKRYGDDGGPMVLFANGYGASGVLLATDAAIQGDAWRVDKPWTPKGG